MECNSTSGFSKSSNARHDEDVGYRYRSSLADFLQSRLKDIEHLEACCRQSSKAGTPSSDVLKDQRLFPLMYPLESYLQLSDEEKCGEVLKSIQSGDVVIGKVVEMNDHGLILKILFLEHCRSILVHNFNIMGYCSRTTLQRRHLADVDVDMFVKAAVRSVNPAKHILELSFEREVAGIDVRLGLLSDDTPEAFRRFTASFPSDLESYNSYENPHCVENMKVKMKIDSTSPKVMQSFLRKGVCMPEGETAAKLRERQSSVWSLSITSVGVNHLKKGESAEALKCFEQALQMDAKNVEALVARGALYANTCKYEDAIVDFEAALAENPEHRNGQKYLVDTLVSYARQHEQDRQWKRASATYNRALAIQPGNEIVLDRVVKLQQILAQQVISGGSIDLTAHSSASSSPTSSRDHAVDIPREGVSYLQRLLKDEKRHKHSKRTHKKKSKKRSKKSKRSSHEPKRKHRRKSDTDSMSSESSEDEWVEKVDTASPVKNSSSVQTTTVRSNKDKRDDGGTSSRTLKHFSSHDKELMHEILSRSRK